LKSFYRAAGFAYFEQLLGKEQLLDEARRIAQSHKQLLASAGFEEFAYEVI
jgi:hypothetical protein